MELATAASISGRFQHRLAASTKAQAVNDPIA
jgi:hypothetical protein